jgi:hypothetical protein
VPGQALADELEVDVGVAHEDDRYETAVAVDVAGNEVHDLVEDQRRGQPLGGPAEGLPKLGAVDPVEADPDALAVAKDGDRVAVVDADDESVEGLRWVGVGARKRARQRGGGEGESCKENGRRSAVAARVGHGTLVEG